MIASCASPTFKRYADFIDSYRDQTKRDLLISFVELIKQVITGRLHEQMRQLKKLFQQLCVYEYDIWDDAYHYEMHYINDMKKNTWNE